jgi:hypothetical protein
MVTFNEVWLQRIQEQFDSFPDKRLTITEKVSKSLHVSNPPGVRKAAVFVPLVNRHGHASLLFTVRSSKVGTHKGQVAAVL